MKTSTNFSSRVFKTKIPSKERNFMELTSYEFNSPQQFAQVLVQQAMIANEDWVPLSNAILRDMLEQGTITHAELDKIVDQVKGQA
jgi:hypothetical protein